MSIARRITYVAVVVTFLSTMLGLAVGIGVGVVMGAPPMWLLAWPGFSLAALILAIAFGLTTEAITWLRTNQSKGEK